MLAGCSNKKETVYIAPEDLLPLTEESYIRGSWDGRTYTNEKLGFTFELPMGWTVYTEKEILKEMGLKPVSYTHLDVYKRQSQEGEEGGSSSSEGESSSPEGEESSSSQDSSSSSQESSSSSEDSSSSEESSSSNP